MQIEQVILLQFLMKHETMVKSIFWIDGKAIIGYKQDAHAGEPGFVLFRPGAPEHLLNDVGIVS